MKIGINVNISRSVWGLVGGNTKNNSSIKTILISRSFNIWGQDWGQDHPTFRSWDLQSNTKSCFYFITNNRK